MYIYTVYVLGDILVIWGIQGGCIQYQQCPVGKTPINPLLDQPMDTLT